MTIQAGIQRQLRYKKETTFGTLAGATGGQILRRLTHSIQFSKKTYNSNEIRSSEQRADMRHGVRSVDGSISGELSAGTYADLLGSLLRRSFTAAPTTGALGAVTLTIAAGAGSTFTITRSGGSFLTDGFKNGMIGAITAGAFNAANLNKNLLIVDIGSATVMTVLTGDGSALVAEGPIGSGTLAATGKSTFGAITGQVNDSYTFEDWHPTIAQSERYAGCRITGASIKLPPTGLATIELNVMGKDMTTATAVYFTTPTVETSTGIAAAANGILRVNGNTLVTVTGVDMKIEGNYSELETVGSNVVPDIFRGKLEVTGSFTAAFEDGVLRDLFVNETECELLLYLPVAGGVAPKFISIALPRIKLGSANMDDGEKGLVRTFNFTALQNIAGGAGFKSENTTIQIQDSDAP